MNTFWPKVAVVVVLVVGAIVFVNLFWASAPQPKPEPKQEVKTEPKTFHQVIEQDDKRLRAQGDTDHQFKELSPEEEVRAEQLFEMALAHRKMGRLPGMSYKLMVDYCRRIIESYPHSSYAAKARRILRDIPQQYRRRYNITDKELGFSD